VNPTISVVIPCYNAAPFLRETLDSVLNQTRPALEVIVVDDGSTDDSAAIAQSYGPPVRVIRQENQGESVARNRGMDEAQGDWIGLLDADDRWMPQKLERQLDALRVASSDVVCVYSDFIGFDSVRRHVVRRPMPTVVSERRARMLTNPWIPTGTAIFLTVIGQKIKFPVNISDGEDRAFFMQLLGQGSFLHVPEPLFEYRQHANQQSGQSGHVIRAIKSMWKWISEHPDALPVEEADLFRRLLIERLVFAHDYAFWYNNQACVAESRSFYREIAPPPAPLPPLFERDLPTWIMRVEYQAWDVVLKVLKILPVRMRQNLLRISRPMIDRAKRGRALTE
jgi:glycosyltransferase involved in cell wall biosynthesis